MRHRLGLPDTKARHYFLVFVFGAAILGLVWRMVDLIIIKRGFLQKQGDARAIRLLKVPAYRGMITDRNGEPLAVSTPVDSLWINPQDFNLQDENIHDFLSLLNLSSDRFNKIIQKNRGKEFVYIKRGLNPNLAKKIKQLKLPGVFFQREFHRYYPEGEVLAHLLGFTDIDDRGQEGIELAYDKWLRGVPGKKRVMKDRLGRVVANVAVLKDPQPGNNLALSIDKKIQYHAYVQLKNAVDKHHAESGSIVVMDVKSGEVLALANQPSFNPNVRSDYQPETLRNRAIIDTIEPGSVLKSFTLAAALQSGKYNTNTVINTSPGYLKINKNLVQDFRNYGKMTVKEVMKKSSNVGVTKMILSLPEQTLWQLLHQVGFGELALGTFPGESAGSLTYREKWPPFTLATMAFGYGLTATPIQLARAFSVFGNDGKVSPTSLLVVQDPGHTKRVLSPKVAKQVLNVLEDVVEKDGTGRLARVKGYRVAGKTSTVRIVGAKGYEKHRHIATFIGIAPVEDPKIVVVIAIRDPKAGQYLGGHVAAPVFSKVAEKILPILRVKPTAG